MIFPAHFKIWCLALLSLCAVLLSPASQASHARYGHISWEPRPEISETTVDFRIVVAFRRSYFGNLQLGSVFRPAAISFGDGKSANYEFEVIALNTQEDWVIGQARQAGLESGTVRHEYPSQARSNGEPWVASLSVCCRIGSLRNSANSNYRVHTNVDLSSGNRSPVSSLPPIVSCARGDCSFSVPAVDKDNDHLRWSLTPLGQSGISRNPTGLTLDTSTGYVDWSAGSQNEPLGLYALSVTIEDLDEFDQPRSAVVVDFIINLRDFVDNQPPVFDQPPSPATGDIINAVVGQTLTLDIQASDSDLNDEVFVNNLGLPAGANVSNLTQGNPSAVRFSWTPSMADLGDKLLTFTATDQKAASALPLSLVIRVIQPMISDVRVIDRIAATDIDIEQSTFSETPADVRLGTPVSEVEWHYPTFDVGQIADIRFDLKLHNLQPGETRLVIHELEMTYRDVNGNLIRDGLGSRAVQVSETVLALSTNTDRIQYRPQEQVIISSQVRNQDEGDTSSGFRLQIVDEQGVLVSQLNEQTLSFTSLEDKTINGYDFSIGNLIAGNYRVRAELLRADGRVTAVAEAPFSVVANSGGALSLATSLYTDKPVYGRWDSVNLSARLQNTSSNAPLTTTRNELLVYAPDGTEVFRQSRDLGSLAPSSMEDFSFLLALNDASQGQYQAVWKTLDATSGQELSRSQAGFRVQSLALQELLGSVQAADSRIYHTGSTRCDFTVRNRAPEAALGTQLAYSLIQADSETLLQRTEISADIGRNDEFTWHTDFSAAGQAYGGYACVLEANINGTWQVLASDSFEVQAPEVSTAISSEGPGRVLVLTDAPRQCSALEDIRVGFDFGAELSTSQQIEIRLYGPDGKLLDTEIVSALDTEINHRHGKANTDLSVKAQASGQFEVLVQSSSGLGKEYRVEVSVKRNWLSKVEKSWTFDCSCDRPLTLNELYEDVSLLAWHPWHSDDDLRNADPFGPLNGPDVNEQNDFIEQLLQDAGWEYTLVHSADDFAREHRLGGYSSYLLLAERPQLHWQVQKELREAVFAGKGLIVAGGFDKRNLWLESALGVAVIGRHPWARELQVHNSDLSSAWNAQLPLADKVQGIWLTGAETLAEYALAGDDQQHNWHWLDKGEHKAHDIFDVKRRAITGYDYGKGRSLFFGFDLLLQATQAGADSSYAELILQALQQIQPDELPALGSAVLPLNVQWQNNRGAVSLVSELLLPEGAELLIPGIFAQQDEHWLATLTLAEQQTLASRLYIKLADRDGEQSIGLLTTTVDGNQQLQQAQASFAFGASATPELAATQALLDSLAWDYWYRLNYRHAWLKFKLAREAINKEHWYQAQTLLLLAADLLLVGHEDDVASARQQVQRHIQFVGEKLAQ
ncbi:hypothetical protein [Thalassolituus pacificus]|uniref:Cadherin domain-containing protein n=1 Tax=Thalassolituus pacificus TaxID=2975440 RepID=A0A9X2WF32_9GAMM|nr:hypothetical protein [Thalassolituus pacificus]MCT7359244.1 hypothetical protein [Thalassolituus pacificus]